MIRARWFDGRSSQARPVLVALQPGTRGPVLRLHPVAQEGGSPMEFQSREVGWPETWSTGRAPRTVIVDLRERGSLEIDDVAQWQAERAAAGERLPLVQRMQTQLTVFVAVLLVAGAALAAFYRWGTPWAATQLTRNVPLAWETSLSERALRDLDGTALKPSKLPPERLAALRARFAALTAQIGPELVRYPDYAPRLDLQFRSGAGANAFALPGGTIVLTDGLVQAAARLPAPDDAIAGVLAHEIGHVIHRHTTRMVVEQSVLNVGLGLALGDVSTIVSMGGSLLTGLAYRRAHESEADCFAVALMRRAQMPTEPMADLLLAMSGEQERAKAAQGANDGGASLLGLLSSHPETPERAQKLKDGALRGCAA